MVEVDACPRTSLHHQYFSSVILKTPARNVRELVSFHHAVKSTTVKPAGTKHDGAEQSDDITALNLIFHSRMGDLPQDAKSKTGT